MISNNGIESKPRGFKVNELINFNLTVNNPRDRVITIPERKFSMAYAFGELLYYLRGDNGLEPIRYYSNFFDNISDDNITINSAYGYRIFGHHDAIPFDQWNNCIRLLTEDKDSRQAIIHIHTPNNKKTKDEVCTLTLQFLIRDNKLNLIVNMRSNDIIFGYTYDAYCFTFMQELMANELNVEVGKYMHNAASFHIYEHGFYGNKFSDFLNDENIQKCDYTTTEFAEYTLNGLTLTNDAEVWNRLFKLEYKLRSNIEVDDAEIKELKSLNKWFNDGINALIKLSNRKYKNIK